MRKERHVLARIQQEKCTFSAEYYIKTLVVVNNQALYHTNQPGLVYATKAGGFVDIMHKNEYTEKWK